MQNLLSYKAGQEFILWLYQSESSDVIKLQRRKYGITLADKLVSVSTSCFHLCLHLLVGYVCT